MTATMCADFVRLWETSLFAWRSEFLRCNNVDDVAQVLKAMHIHTAVDLVASLREPK